MRADGAEGAEGVVGDAAGLSSPWGVWAGGGGEGAGCRLEEASRRGVGGAGWRARLRGAHPTHANTAKAEGREKEISVFFCFSFLFYDKGKHLKAKQKHVTKKKLKIAVFFFSRVKKKVWPEESRNAHK